MKRPYLLEDERWIELVNSEHDQNINTLLHKISTLREQVEELVGVTADQNLRLTQAEKTIDSLREGKCLGVIPGTFIVCGEGDEDFQNFCSELCLLKNKTH